MWCQFGEKDDQRCQCSPWGKEKGSYFTSLFETSFLVSCLGYNNAILNHIWSNVDPYFNKRTVATSPSAVASPASCPPLPWTLTWWPACFPAPRPCKAHTRQASGETSRPESRKRSVRKNGRTVKETAARGHEPPSALWRSQILSPCSRNEPSVSSGRRAGDSTLTVDRNKKTRTE